MIFKKKKLVMLKFREVENPLNNANSLILEVILSNAPEENSVFK